MKGIRLLHLKHANEENPKSIEAVIEMEASSMLHKVYLANSVSPCLTRKGCWFSMLESLQNGQSTNHPVFRCVRQKLLKRWTAQFMMGSRSKDTSGVNLKTYRDSVPSFRRGHKQLEGILETIAQIIKQYTSACKEQQWKMNRKTSNYGMMLNTLSLSS